MKELMQISYTVFLRILIIRTRLNRRRSYRKEEGDSRRHSTSVNSSCTLAGALAVIKAVKVAQGRKQMERWGGISPGSAARRRKSAGKEVSRSPENNKRLWSRKEETDIRSSPNSSRLRE